MESLIKLFAPPLQIDNSTGKAWGDLTFVERVQSYDWTKELIILALLAGYVALHYFGVQSNKNRVNKWIQNHQEVLDQQFAQVGVNLPDDKLVVSDSPTIFTTYASGRLNINHLLARFKLKERQNFVTLTMDYVLSFFFPSSFQVKDTIDLVLSPSDDAKIDPFVFAIVNKADMKDLRNDNYYLSLTRTVDSDKLPNYLTFMTESAEVTDTIFTNELKEAVQDSSNVLEYLAIADQEINRPKTIDEAAPRPIIRLGLKFTSNAKDLEVSKRILNAAINTVDHCVSKAHWRPEVARKIKATREAEVKKIQKAIEEEKAEERALKKAEAEREKRKQREKLSLTEQRKLEQKERDKQEKRKINKQSRKGVVRG